MTKWSWSPSPTPNTRLRSGAHGVVTHVDAAGTVDVHRYDGNLLGLLRGIDHWITLPTKRRQEVATDHTAECPDDLTRPGLGWASRVAKPQMPTPTDPGQGRTVSIVITRTQLDDLTTPLADAHQAAHHHLAAIAEVTTQGDPHAAHAAIAPLREVLAIGFEKALALTQELERARMREAGLLDRVCELEVQVHELELQQARDQAA